jgi:hypothetical protein
VAETIVLAAHYAVVVVVSGAVPIFGAAVWALLRPEPASLKRERDLAKRLAEEEIYGGDRCLDCRAPVEAEWLRCPHCTAKLHERCECGALLELYWNACPWCAAELGKLERDDEPADVVRAAAA